MKLNINQRNNPFTKEGFRLFIRRDIPASILIMVMFMILFYLFSKQTFLVAPAAKKMAWANREVAILHAFCISTVSFLMLMDKISTSTWYFMLNITRGYLLADLLMIYLFPAVSNNIKLDIMHHLFFFIITLYANKGPRNVAFGLTGEVSLVPLYGSWYMLKWKMNSQPSFYVISVVALLAYAVRITIFTYLLIKVWREYSRKDGNIELIQPIIFIPITLMNYMWFYKLVKKAFKFLG